ncbi:Hint domain-containing protein [uncultured Tateyamaria sp.]|uniref:Hint domain-containing protein n=1 Tax=uncultured Tateyamaria sp. TaxID=455651 RepID=UPI0026092172|nr:Hint domain-containing protein [uncultured Tateyamaria sp.]
MVAASELPIQTVREGVDATDMANAIFGNGVQVVSASYTGDRDSAGIYSNGDTVSPGVTPGDTGVILSTGDAEDFTNSSGSSNQSNSTSTNTSGQNNNGQFNAAAGARTYDASYLDVDFIPDGNVMTMQFVFSSEEYPEFQNSIYQDFVGVWVNGQQVEMDVGDGDTDPGNINTTNNINMFVDNSNDDYNTEMDGFTITLTLTMVVNPDVVNSIRIGIADVGDNRYDSSLLIAGNSVQTHLVAISDDVNVYPDGTTSFNVLNNDVSQPGTTLTITHINGQAVSYDPVTGIGTTITLPTGQLVTIGANGQLTVVGDGDEENFNFTYTVTDGTDTDTGFVNATSIPCFVAGTLIETTRGPVPVETLQPGDLVMTEDDGPQPLRWIGTRTVAAEADFAPILIRAGTFGSQADVMVSPLHRVLVRDSLAELLFGEAEVLVAAKDLINDHSVLRQTGGTVTYVHLMFDKHQVVFSEGLATESFLPGPQTTKSFEKEIVAEICAIFPELDPRTGDGYSPSARRTLRRYEADLWRKAQAAA